MAVSTLGGRRFAKTKLEGLPWPWRRQDMASDAVAENNRDGVAERSSWNVTMGNSVSGSIAYVPAEMF